MSKMLEEPVVDVEEVPPAYFVELSKSGRAECKKCDCKIENKSLRVGVMIDGEWGLLTRWQHLDCTVFPKAISSVDMIDGFQELNAENKKLVIERFDASANEVDDDTVPVNPDELVRKAWDQPLEPSSDLLMPLLPYQKEGLGWMVSQEQNEVHGGILADEMGMGKTIQAISLMLHNRPNTTDFQQMREWATSDERHGVKEELMRAGTLIVLPTVAIRQWQTEIARFTRGGALTVKVYHGSDRNTSAQDLTGVDVVLTSYKILEIEYRKATAGTKVTCKLCGKKFYPDKLRVHRKYFCGEGAQRTEAQALTQRKPQQRPANAFGRSDGAAAKATSSSGGGAASKRRRVGGGGAAAEGSGSEEEDQASSEDEVARQKRQIKERKAAEEAKASAKSAKSIKSAKSTAAAKRKESPAPQSKSTATAKKSPADQASKTAPQATRKRTTKASAKMPSVKREGASDEEEVQSEPDGAYWDAIPTDDEDVPVENAQPAKKGGRASIKGTPAKGAPAKSTASARKASGSHSAEKATPVAAVHRTASPGTSLGSSSAVKRTSPRTAAQVQRQYCVDSSGSDSGDADSVYDSEAAAASEEEAEAEDAEGADSASESDRFTSDEEEEKVGGRKRGTRTTGQGKAKAQDRGSAKAPIVKSQQSGSASKSTARGQSSSSAAAAAAVSAGKKRGRQVAEESEDEASSAHDDDNGSESSEGSDSDDDGSEDSSGEGTGKGKVKGKGKGKGKSKGGRNARAVLNSSDVDSEVERDIAEAIAEAARALARSKAKPPKSVLHLLSWFRVILDEAHLIKDRSTSTAKAVFNLVSLNKWCLTGTPLQNRVGELYSLIRFLRIDPHAFYYCRSKGCDCKSLHYRFTASRCDECSHSVIQHYCHFNKHILNPIKRAGYVSEGRRAMLKLKQQVLDEILLRRTKTTRAEDIQLPPRVVKVRQERLDEKEEDFYQALYTQSQAQFNTYLQSGTVLNNYAHIFDILIRLRQAVDHPYLVIYSEAQTASKQDSSDFLNVTGGAGADDAEVAIKEEKGDCDLCHEPWEDPVTAECGHCFCRPCISDYIASMSSNGNNGNGNANGGNEGLRCPDCDAALTIQLNGAASGTGTASRGRASGASRSNGNSASAGAGAGAGASSSGDLSVWDASKAISRRSILDKIDLSLFQSSTKIEALMEELHKMQQEDLGAKAIVFSQFVNMLDIISYRVQRGGIACVKLSGSMNLEQRDKAIAAFKGDPGVKVLLISLKAGGVALNLTVASRIFLMDPWWNPAAEMQAIDRTHRIGQFKPIYATRFIIENTIEERILRLQDKKKLVFDGTVGGDAGSMSKLTVDDMRFLFN